MKRLSLLAFGALLAAFYPGSGVAYAQGAHGAGAGMSGMHGSSGSHGNGASSAGGHASSKVMSSTNPGDVLDRNSHLATKLEGLLGLTGPNALDTLKTDASGFKNFGQFVAAVHVSNNLGIPFSDLQGKMTGPSPVSLGKAIHELKPTANSKTETKKAMNQANADVKASS